MKINENQWKSIKKHWKSMKIIRKQWKINENIWKSIDKHWKSMKTITNWGFWAGPEQSQSSPKTSSHCGTIFGTIFGARTELVSRKSTAVNPRGIPLGIPPPGPPTLSSISSSTPSGSTSSAGERLPSSVGPFGVWKPRAWVFGNGLLYWPRRAVYK